MNDRKLVSASKIGKMAWCPHGSSLQEQGVIASALSQAKADYGTASHESVTAAVFEQQTQDQRCFVASYALGSNHPATQRLRDWRDSYLSHHYLGRILIKAYYALSPSPSSCYLPSRVHRLQLPHWSWLSPGWWQEIRMHNYGISHCLRGFVALLYLARRRSHRPGSPLGIEGKIVYADQGRKSKLFINKSTE